MRVIKTKSLHCSAAGYAADGGKGFMMEGEVIKRGRTFKVWHKRYFRQKTDCIEYYLTKVALVPHLTCARA